jgi:hypothetical protein
MPPPLDARLLHGTWLHAHEEDTHGRTVFRRPTDQLPPSRGRLGYTIDFGGRIAAIGSGPADRTASVRGSWSLDSEGRITIRLPGQDDRTMKVLSLDADRLVVEM